MNIFITGASSGIGEALATEYAKRYSANTSENSMPGSRMDIGSQSMPFNIGLVAQAK